MPTNTVGGGIDQTAVIGHAPEARGWAPDQVTHAPDIHATARVEAFATIDAGMERATMLCAGAWCFKHSHIGHDAIVDRDAEICTGAIIGGYAYVGVGAKVGIGAVVLPHRKIGADAVVGAGAVVTKDVPPGVTVAGNPARVIERNPIPHTERHGSARTAGGTADTVNASSAK